MGVLSDVTIPLDEMIQPTEELGNQLIRSVLVPLFYDIAEAGFELTVKAIATRLGSPE